MPRKAPLMSAAGEPTGVLPTPAALAKAVRSSIEPRRETLGVASGVGMGVERSVGCSIARYLFKREGRFSF